MWFEAVSVIGQRKKVGRSWICSSSGYCEVTAKGPSQTRRKVFFDHDHTLPEKVRDWLELYPFR